MTNLANPVDFELTAVEIDPDGPDSESAYGDELLSYSESLSSTARDFEWMYGRRYHAYQSGTCEGRLHFAPLGNAEGMRILDIGTGWHSQDASKCEVLWSTMSRLIGFPGDSMITSSADTWPAPFRIGSDWLGNATNNKNVEILELLHVACDKVGRPLSPGPLLEGWVRDAGFVNVDRLLMRILLGTWPRDKQLKEIGAYMTLIYAEGIHAFINAPFAQTLGWSRERVEAFNEEVRRDVLNPHMHGMYHISGFFKSSFFI
ncbi:hypothetical protein VTN00DRAFT_4985 [Thermoascus crustaceus]|uniref:uncharacterized protein n=1 Tax=Thermoascus crustaceus TaxID=5088 RepID=UPI003741F04B